MHTNGIVKIAGMTLMVLKKLVRFILSQGTIFSKFKKRTQFEVSAQYQVGNNHRYTEMHAVIN